MAPVRRGDGKAAVPESERAQFANARRADVARIAAELRELKAAKAGKEAVRAKAWELLEQKYLLCLHSPEPVTAPELVVATSPTHVMKVRWGIRVAARGRENSVRASGGAAYSSNVVKLQHKFYNRVRLEGHEVIEAISSHTARRFPDLAPSLCKLEVVERHEADGGDGAAPTVRKVYSQLQPNTVLRMPLTNPGPVLSFTTVIEIRATFQTAPPAVPSDLPPLVDLGVNLSNERFEKSLGKVIDRAVQAGVTQQVSLATELWDSTFGVALSKSRPGTLFTTVGVHPTRACDALKAMSVDATRNALAALVKASRVRALYEGEPSSLHQTVVAIGECGLCFTDGTTEEDKKIQLAVLEMQLKLAGELQLPVIMQERGAFSDILPLVEKCVFKVLTCVQYASTVPNLIVSCFNGPKKHLQAYVDNGLFIGVTGLLCNDARNTELVTALSSVVGIRDRLMVSSDAPFLTPFNMPKPFPKDNEPFTLPYVVQKLAIELEADVHALAQELAARSRTVLSLNDQSFSEPAQGGERHKAVPADNPNCDYAFYGPSAQSFAPSKPQ